MPKFFLKNNNNKNKTFTSILIPVCVILGIALLLLVGSVISKYIRVTDSFPYLLADEFYFESDVLSIKGESHTITPSEIDSSNYGKTNKITFTLMNYDDDLRYSANDIIYTYTVVRGDGTTVETDSGTLDGGKESSETITVSDEISASETNDNQTYVVTVTTNNTYTKTLRGTFTVVGANPLYYSVEDHDEYVLLTVWNDLPVPSGSIQIAYPEELIPDTTQDIFKAFSHQSAEVSNDKRIFNDEYFDDYSNRSVVYRFFKSDLAIDYNYTDFTITHSSVNNLDIIYKNQPEK